ncbi:MAG: hypothetical protein EBQ96_02760 [Proteobacteria bacterium]|nr:hypothetical protein [Pseudomonadota bacterium]
MRKKKQDGNLGPDMRAKIAASLPDAIDFAMQSYRKFYEREKYEDAKDFSAHHSACKTAIAHIELLLKLAAWAKLPDDDTDHGLAALLSDAEAELKRYNAEEDDDE